MPATPILRSAGPLRLTAPVSTSQWPNGYPQTIAWTLNSTTATVNIYYSLDNGGTYTLITTGGPVNAQNLTTTTGNYSWTPPLTAVSTLSKIKVVDSTDVNVLGISDTFALIASVKVTSPNAGTEVWRVGDTQNITWTLGGSFANAKIEYSTDGG